MRREGYFLNLNQNQTAAPTTRIATAIAFHEPRIEIQYPTPSS